MRSRVRFAGLFIFRQVVVRVVVIAAPALSVWSDLGLRLFAFSQGRSGDQSWLEKLDLKTICLLAVAVN